MNLVLFLLTLNFTPAKSEIVDRVAVIVNNEIITESDVDSLKKKMATKGMVDDLLLLNNSIETVRGSSKLLIDFLVNERILASEIKRLNLAVTQDRVDTELREVAKENNFNKDELVAALKSQGINYLEYREFLKNKIERQALIQSEISSKIRISDEEVSSEYFKSSPNASNTVYEYTIAHILFSTKKSGEEGARKKAETVLVRLKNGEAFETLAEQFSEDPGFNSGGLLGVFKAGEFSKEFEKAILNLAPGDVSEITTKKMGIHILKLISKKVVSDSKFEKEKPRIMGKLYEKAFKLQFGQWLERKREESFIRINTP